MSAMTGESSMAHTAPAPARVAIKDKSPAPQPQSNTLGRFVATLPRPTRAEAACTAREIAESYMWFLTWSFNILKCQGGSNVLPSGGTIGRHCAVPDVKLSNFPLGARPSSGHSNQIRDNVKCASSMTEPSEVALRGATDCTHASQLAAMSAEDVRRRGACWARGRPPPSGSGASIQKPMPLTAALLCTAKVRLLLTVWLGGWSPKVSNSRSQSNTASLEATTRGSMWQAPRGQRRGTASSNPRSRSRRDTSQPRMRGNLSSSSVAHTRQRPGTSLGRGRRAAMHARSKSPMADRWPSSNNVSSQTPSQTTTSTSCGATSTTCTPTKPLSSSTWACTARRSCRGSTKKTAQPNLEELSCARLMGWACD
mmetsp:Transcript_139216/g.444950  ORF Transcript_139216/g.444950 Transcript_139216/m.444950 type:complete len:368 (-) Transcript_139216:103-1206(-)